MIEVTIQVSKQDPDRVAQLEVEGFDPELEREAFDHKEALGRILLGNSSWRLVVSEVDRYLLIHCSTYSWRIKVLQEGVVIRRVESLAYPIQDGVVQTSNRVSRYARTPII